MSKNIRILLDSPTNSYYAGTTVTGRVVTTFDKPEKARGLKIHIEGGAKVSWDASETENNAEGRSETRTVTYHAEEEYFSNKYYLVGNANGDIEIPAGEHIYPFTTTLPPQLPTSFDGEHGHVRYTIKVTLDRPWKTDYEAKSLFTVITPCDLNYHSVAKEQGKVEVEKTFCCCCCRSGPLTLVVWLPHKGYVPNQNIPVTVEVDNASNIQVNSIECKLIKKLKFMVRMPRYDSKTDFVDLVTLNVGGGVAGGGSATLTQSLTIPNMPFVNLDACSIIDVSFVLKVTAVVSGAHSNLEAEIPIILGTIAIQENAGPAPQGFVPQQNFSPYPPPYSGGDLPPPYPGESFQPYPIPGHAVPYGNNGNNGKSASGLPPPSAPMID